MKDILTLRETNGWNLKVNPWKRRFQSGNHHFQVPAVSFRGGVVDRVVLHVFMCEVLDLKPKLYIERRTHDITLPTKIAGIIKGLSTTMIH